MRVNGFRCDGCGKEYLLAPTLAFQGYSDALPDAWFLVSRGKYDREREPVLFCSKECVAEWASASSSDHTPYTFCCAEHYPLPERRKS